MALTPAGFALIERIVGTWQEWSDEALERLELRVDELLAQGRIAGT